MRRDAGLAGVRAHGRRTRFRGCFAYAPQLKEITHRIKELADAGQLSEEELDNVLRDWVIA